MLLYAWRYNALMTLLQVGSFSLMYYLTNNYVFGLIITFALTVVALIGETFRNLLLNEDKVRASLAFNEGSAHMAITMCIWMLADNLFPSVWRDTLPPMLAVCAAWTPLYVGSYLKKHGEPQPRWRLSIACMPLGLGVFWGGVELLLARRRGP